MKIHGRVAIITDDPGWHGRCLSDALCSRGYASSMVSLTECAYRLDDGVCTIDIPGFYPQLPDGVFVRGIAGGTLEQVVFYLNVLHGLRHAGVKVYNDGRAIERTVDKALTSFLLQEAGISMPPTWVFSNRTQAMHTARHELLSGYQLVFKPLFGSQGEGLQLIRHVDMLDQVFGYNGIYYFQRFICSCADNYFDWRVFVVNGKAISAAKRSGTHWLNNVAQGGICEPASLDNNLRQLAEKAVSVLNMDYGGVDIIADADNRLYVLEVNSVPAWKGLQKVCQLSVADCLVDDFLSKLKHKKCVQIAEI
ncbi:MAG TPA: RimK family alpha-L-glutamate ligase [Crenotrichaceae bacterium]|nr:RimK family alpha-L-glutamate ligase [Crenotrichaceae bacterium]